MLVNIFDSNFDHTNCSTAFQTSRYIEYARRLMDFDGVTLFTDEWINNPIVEQVNSRYKVGWLREPYCLHPQTYERALANVKKFDFILTYYEPLLMYEPFQFVPYGGVWVAKREWGIKPKSKLCSMLIGSKMSTEGHRLRHDIAAMIDKTGWAVDFYGVKGEPVGYEQDTKYKVLADYCFSIVTETCREDNLFTEWLLDCFALGTVPIFWGAPNIDTFFNAKGILQFDTLDRLYKIMAGLSVAQWDKNINAICANLTAMTHYAVTEDWLFLNVLRELE